MKNIFKALICGAATLAFLTTSVTPPTAEAKGTAEIKSETIYVGHDLWAAKSASSTIHSTGGIVKVCGWTDNRGGQTQVYVEETDEAGNPSEKVGTYIHYFYNDCLKIDVSKFVDGTNKKAELKFRFARTDNYMPAKNVSFSFYD